jgi:hypothetical protein
VIAAGHVSGTVSAAGTSTKRPNRTANPEHLKLLQQGIDVWNEWRAKEPSIVPDLSEAKLRGADLSEGPDEGRDGYAKVLFWP